MNTLAFAAPALQRLKAELEHAELESAAILLCSPMLLSTGAHRLLVVETHVPTEADYAHRTPIRAELCTEFCLPIERKARQENLALIYVHTHPGGLAAQFSHVDDETERALAKYLGRRGPHGPHASLLFAEQGINARMLGTSEPLRVVELGDSLVVHLGANMPLDDPDGRFDRQVRAFGAEGQQLLSTLRLAIVGLGGTGSLMAQQAAHLGVRHFLLVDDDLIEATNLNRVVGARRRDIGRPKVEIAKRMIRAINPNATVEVIKADVTAKGVARRVVEEDAVFCCTDSHASRHILNQAAYQYLTPVIDMGVAITVAGNGGARFDGHVKLLSPGQACLWCANNLDSTQVQRELMTDEQRAKDPYIQGAERVPQPAVVSLNSTVASISMTMLLSVIAGVPAAPRYIIYQGNRARMNAATCAVQSGCWFCGPKAPIASGDRTPLPEKAT